jgi:hypothetical protein
MKFFLGLSENGCGCGLAERVFKIKRWHHSQGMKETPRRIACDRTGQVM